MTEYNDVMHPLLGKNLFTREELGLSPKIDMLARYVVEKIFTSNAYLSRVEHRYGKVGNLRVIFNKELVDDLKDGIYNDGHVDSNELVEAVVKEVQRKFNTPYLTVHSMDSVETPTTFVDPRLIEADTPQQGYLDIYYTVEEPEEDHTVDDLKEALDDVTKRLKEVEDKQAEMIATTTTTTTTEAPAETSTPVEEVSATTVESGELKAGE